MKKTMAYLLQEGFSQEEAENIIDCIDKIVLVMDDDSIMNDIEHDYITINTCRNGRDVVWYEDGEPRLTPRPCPNAVYLDTGEALSESEIEEQLVY